MASLELGLVVVYHILVAFSLYPLPLMHLHLQCSIRISCLIVHDPPCDVWTARHIGTRNEEISLSQIGVSFLFSNLKTRDDCKLELDGFTAAYYTSELYGTHQGSIGNTGG